MTVLLITNTYHYQGNTDSNFYKGKVLGLFAPVVASDVDSSVAWKPLDLVYFE